MASNNDYTTPQYTTQCTIASGGQLKFQHTTPRVLSYGKCTGQPTKLPSIGLEPTENDVLDQLRNSFIKYTDGLTVEHLARKLRKSNRHWSLGDDEAAKSVDNLLQACESMKVCQKIGNKWKPVSPNDQKVETKRESGHGWFRTTVLLQPLAVASKPGELADNTLESFEKQDDMQVFVKTPDGKHVSLSLTPSTTVEFVKRTIESTYLLPIDQQRLIFEGQQLEDDRMCKHYKIHNHATLHLVLRLLGGAEIRIEICTPDGKLILLSVQKDDTIQHLKSLLMAKTGIPCQHQRLMFAGKQKRNEAVRLVELTVGSLAMNKVYNYAYIVLVADLSTHLL